MCAICNIVIETHPERTFITGAMMTCHEEYFCTQAVLTTHHDSCITNDNGLAFQICTLALVIVIICIAARQANDLSPSL